MADEDFRITQVETKHILLGWHVIIHSTDGIRKEWHPTKQGAEKAAHLFRFIASEIDRLA